MRVEITDEARPDLEEYARVPISFEVREILQIGAPGESPLSPLPTRRLDRSFIKDYDASPDGGPLDWSSRFDVRHWGFLVARSDVRLVGGTVAVFPADDLQARPDRAVLWDLRVAPHFRRRGIGSALVRRAEEWARHRGAGWLGVETQNINVPAYRLYTRAGFVLAKTELGAYPSYPDEIMLWLEKPLT